MSKPKFRIYTMNPHPTSGVRVHLKPLNKEAENMWLNDGFGLVRYAEEIKQQRLLNL